MVGFAVMDGDNGSVGRGEDRATEAWELLRRFRTQQCPESHRGCAVSITNRFEADRVGGGEYPAKPASPALRALTEFALRMRAEAEMPAAEFGGSDADIVILIGRHPGDQSQ